MGPPRLLPTDGAGECYSNDRAMGTPRFEGGEDLPQARAGLLIPVMGEEGERSRRAGHSQGRCDGAHQPLSNDQPPLCHHGWCLPAQQVPWAGNRDPFCQN